ncbi:hypothetical protein ASPCADRAFT_409084 [Aspergillus carbonarius ITEM 5010]|uniref:Uncharacterized protein n=1 Tax=Aspergillus carbonarius (strain ITEM 5010) TaxID=602072 RepID=A0A1R3RAG7_ASPC5|nr:hypothetical protein ASPCADRAFT_409084 [Aspergillus carbonarius ITEM 5010]
MSWEVTSFTVQSVTGGAETLYANGQMQIPAIVSIKAIDTTTYASYKLTQVELESIQLVDYFSPTTVLQGSWFYSTHENEFAHTMPTTRDPGQPVLDDGAQHIYFWVSSTKVENKRIAARITQPNQTVVTTNSSAFNSWVIITTREPRPYTRDDVTVVREDTKEGVFYILKNNSYTKNGRWDQDNYYITSNRHPFVKADRYNYGATKNDLSVNAENVSLSNSWAYLPDKNNCSMFFFWDLGESMFEWDLVGLDINLGGSGLNYYSARLGIHFNQRSNAFCLTRMYYWGHDQVWGSSWSKSAWFRLYDLYGNSGDFYPRADNKNTISIHQRLSRAGEPTDAVGPEAKL